MKGRFLKKLKRFPTKATLKQGLILQVPDSISINKLSNDHHKDEEIESAFFEVDKEKLTPFMKSRDQFSAKDNSELVISSGVPEIEEQPSLLDFEEKCPPGGRDSVIFYTTSLRGIRKTFEDCSAVRFLLESFRISFQERDVSMDIEFREELWRMMGGRVVPPRLFIKGRHIGGADEVVGLHEQGKLKKLLEGMPLSPSNNSPCMGCAGIRFLLCFNCNGSCKVFADGDGNGVEIVRIRCPECNENGLVKCPICC